MAICAPIEREVRDGADALGVAARDDEALLPLRMFANRSFTVAAIGR